MPWLEGTFYEAMAASLMSVTRKMKNIQSGGLSAYLGYVLAVFAATLLYETLQNANLSTYLTYALIGAGVVVL